MPDATSAGSHFGFDRLGLRVPAILISPWVGEGVALTNLGARVGAASAAPAAADTAYSQHQRSLVSLAEVLAARASSAAAGIHTHARNFLNQPQSP